jgi:hypothetical protein
MGFDIPSDFFHFRELRSRWEPGPQSRAAAEVESCCRDSGTVAGSAGLPRSS